MMKEKKKYIAPEMDAYEVKTADVIATSVTTEEYTEEDTWEWWQW